MAAYHASQQLQAARLWFSRLYKLDVAFESVLSQISCFFPVNRVGLACVWLLDKALRDHLASGGLRQHCRYRRVN